MPSRFVPLLRTAFGRPPAFFARFAWLLFSALCVLLGYLLIWQRGPYLDDYANLALAYNPHTDQWRPIHLIRWDQYFPVRILEVAVDVLFAGLLPRHEFLARLLMTLGVAMNALLLGALVFRLLGSRLAAVISGWVFLVPYIAFEAVLWAGAIDYPVVVLCALVFLHVCWSTLTAPRLRLPWVLLGGVCFALMLLCSTKTLAVGFVVPVLGVLYATRPHSLGYRTALVRTFASLVIPTLLTAADRVLYLKSSLVAERGGAVTSVGDMLQRVPVLWHRLQWLLVSDPWGEPAMRTVFLQGSTILRHSPPGLGLFVAAGLSLALMVGTWRPQTAKERAMPTCTGVLLVLLGVTWGITALFFPAALSARQLLEYRMLYFPLAGVGITCGAVVWLAVRRLRGPIIERFCVAVTGSVLLLSTIPLMGFSDAFATRATRDHAQVAAAVAAMPAAMLPPETVLVPIAMDAERAATPSPVAPLLVGVFEASWSAEGALNVAYERKDVRCIVMNRHGGIRFHTQGRRLHVQGTMVSENRTVLFTYRRGRVLVIAQLTILGADGTTETIHFPIAEQLGKRGTATLMDVTVRDDQPLYGPLAPPPTRDNPV